jgi:uroporphyrinogen-III synthase
MRLLVTRPEADAARTAATLRGRGHEVVLAPLLRFEPMAAALPPGPFDAVVMSSANAARAIAAHPQRSALADLPVFAVGARTAEAARHAGFAHVTSASGDVAALARHIVAALPGAARLIHLAGEDRAGDLASALAEPRIEVQTLAIYRAVASDALPPPVIAALSSARIDGVLHYSARSAATFLACAARANIFPATLALTHYCLSAQVAAPLLAASAELVRVASTPDEPHLLALLDPSAPV